MSNLETNTSIEKQYIGLSLHQAKEIKTATIECCAKVAEFYGEMNGTHTTIAAAIRALKDETA